MHLGYIIAIILATIWVVLSIVERIQRKNAEERLKEQLDTINESED